jgi:hypothetical protein
MMKQAIPGLVLAAALSSAQAQDDIWTPDAKTIARADRAVLPMYQPPEDPPLKTYSRYYLGVISAGHRMILGKLLSPGLAETRKTRESSPSVEGLSALVHIVTDRTLMPAYADGGCGIENVTYDVTEAKVTVAFCNIAGPGGPLVPHLPPRISPLNQRKN